MQINPLSVTDLPPWTPSSIESNKRLGETFRQGFFGICAIASGSENKQQVPLLGLWRGSWILAFLSLIVHNLPNCQCMVIFSSLWVFLLFYLFFIFFYIQLLEILSWCKHCSKGPQVLSWKQLASVLPSPSWLPGQKSSILPSPGPLTSGTVSSSSPEIFHGAGLGGDIAPSTSLEI